MSDEVNRLEEKLKRSKDKNHLLNAQTKKLEQTLATPAKELHQQNWRLRTEKDEVVRWINRLIDEARRSDSRKIQALRRDAIRALQGTRDTTATYICTNCDGVVEADDAEYAECSVCYKEIVACSECVADDVAGLTCFICTRGILRGTY